MDSEKTRDMTRHIRRMCVLKGHPAWAEEDVPPERRYEEAETVGEMLKQRVGIFRRICCNGMASFVNWANEWNAY